MRGARQGKELPARIRPDFLTPVPTRTVWCGSWMGMIEHVARRQTRRMRADLGPDTRNPSTLDIPIQHTSFEMLSMRHLSSIASLVACFATWTPHQATAQQAAVRSHEIFRTSSGRTFLLVDSGARAPLVHWARASRIGPGEDPRGIPGLARACVRASFDGVSMHAAAPNAADASDSDQSWRRALATLPALGPQVYETRDSSVVVVRSTVAASGRLARLLRLRQSGAGLPRLERHLQAVQQRAASLFDDPRRPLRDELLGLAYHGTDRFPTELSLARNSRNELDPAAAAAVVWARTQAASRTFDVLVAPIDLQAWKPMLEAEFGANASGVSGEPTALGTPVPPRLGTRRAKLPHGSADLEAAAGVGFFLPGWGDSDAPSHEVLAQLESWLTGPNGPLTTALRKAGFPRVQTAWTAPFPGNRRPGLVLVEAWIPNPIDELLDVEPAAPQITPTPLAGDRGEALERALLAALQSFAKGPGPDDATLDRIAARRRRQHQTMLDRPDLLALQLARRCGIGGEPPATVLDVPARLTATSLVNALAKMMRSGDRTIVTLAGAEPNR